MSRSSVTKAVVLARGLGTRMRREDTGVSLSRAEAVVAATGVKAMIPVGRPFLDYVLSALADAGIRDVCLVVGPEHDSIRDRYARRENPRRLAVHFAIQERPLGTADAVAAAEEFAGDDLFLALNSDNYYPVAAYRALRDLGRPGLVAFEREALVRESNIPAERVRQYAILDLAGDGSVRGIVEKPDETALAAAGPEIFISMNLFLFGPSIFEACRRVTPSVRGELELADALRIAIDDLGGRFEAIPFRAGVLDLSRRGDIAAVAERLSQVEVAL